MKVSVVLGYKDIFPEQQDRYEDLMEELDSESAIRVCSALNNELNGAGGMQGNQGNVLKDIALRFTNEQKLDWDNRFKTYLEKDELKAAPVLFNNRNFLEMVIRELARRSTVSENKEALPITEYNFLKAYMLVGDELALVDHAVMDKLNPSKADPLFLMKIIWASTVTKFEYLEKSSQIFETVKTMCFLKFLLNSAYHPYLKEYLEKLHLNSPGAYLMGFRQLMNSIDNFDPNSPLLKRLNYIMPNENVDQTFLRHLSVNLKEQKQFKLADIKKAPLCYAADRRAYMVIDYNFLIKKMYRGAFFEICHTTSLTRDKEKEERDCLFNTYVSQVSDALEHTLFKPVMEQLFLKHKPEIVHFDDQTPNVPDCYCRIGNVIFLFEYKAYTFPEEQILKPDFDKFISYLEERFVKSDSESPKGISQLYNQIKIAYELHQSEILHIFPILVHSDFNYTMPGTNRYLHEKFTDLLSKFCPDNLRIAPLVMINLETILDLSITGKTINDLGISIEKFIEFVNQNQQEFAKTASQTALLRASSSFDAFYHQHIAAPSREISIPEKIKELVALAKISIDELNAPLS
jgi:hypothetical protein